MIKRAIYFIAGLFVMSLGVAFSIKSSLGTTPISSISYSLALCTGVNIGITTIVFNGALVFIQMLVLKKRFEAKRLLQFINCFLFGYFTGFSYLYCFFNEYTQFISCKYFYSDSVNIFNCTGNIHLYACRYCSTARRRVCRVNSYCY